MTTKAAPCGTAPDALSRDDSTFPCLFCGAPATLREMRAAERRTRAAWPADHPVPCLHAVPPDGAP